MSNSDTPVILLNAIYCAAIVCILVFAPGDWKWFALFPVIFLTTFSRNTKGEK